MTVKKFNPFKCPGRFTSFHPMCFWCAYREICRHDSEVDI